MKIAQIAPIVERVPPKRYGGTERVVHVLTEELVRRGHEVTLFASGDSLTLARLISAYPRSLREVGIKDLYGANALSLLSIGLAYEMQADFDIIHDHTGHLSLPTANIARTPVLMTLHGPITLEAHRMFRILRRPRLVTISAAQGRSAPDLNYAGTVYNGLAMRTYPFSAEHEGYLLFVGRISMEKGVHLAVRAAQEMNLPLVIAAKLESEDRPYFQEYVEPFLSEQIRWVGEVDERERNRLMSKALCFLHPATWDEPFGLTLIEAMACGSPVVAFDRGSIPEIVQDRKTGFVVRNIGEMIRAIQGINTISRKRCRLHALRKFGAERMAGAYMKLYEELLHAKAAGHLPTTLRA